MASLKNRESKEVALRFAEAYKELHYRGLVRSKSEFCRKVGIMNMSNFLRIINPDTSNEPTITQILNLVKKYNVSWEWLFFGEGEFIKTEK